MSVRVRQVGMTTVCSTQKIIKFKSGFKMKNFIVFYILAFCASITVVGVVTSVIPSADQSVSEQKELVRTRRDLNGVFDSIANGVGGLMTGVQQVTDSIKNAFNNIFSDGNKKAVRNGFEQFQNGMKSAWGGLFGANGVVSNGFKKIGNSIKGAFNGKGNQQQGQGQQNQNQGQSQGSGGRSGCSGPCEKAVTPQGQVPDGETT